MADLKNHEKSVEKTAEVTVEKIVRRRSFHRASLPQNLLVRVSQKDPHQPLHARLQAVDVGVGGLSLLVEQEQGPLLKPGFEDVWLSFELAGRTIEAGARVQNRRVWSKDVRYDVVGVEFSRITADEIFAISGYVVDTLGLDG